MSITSLNLAAVVAATAGTLWLSMPVQAANDAPVSAPYEHGGFTTKEVRFSSSGIDVVGLLYVPLPAGPAVPGVVLLGPFGSIKEQSPMQYATRLAREGYATLVFDPRFSGESGGEPRRLESPSAKVGDVKSAIDFLERQPEVDRTRLAALGICQGSSEMIAVAAEDDRLKALAVVSGQYIYPKNIEGFFGGGGPTREERIARGVAARARFESTGHVDYTEVVSLSDKAAGLPWKPIHDWYLPWTSEKWLKPSRWENRYATMSDEEVWSFDVDEHAVKVKVPTLIIHGEMSDGNVEAAQHVFDRIQASDKKLVVVPGVFHTRFYDDPSVIDPATAQVSAWLKQHLK